MSDASQKTIEPLVALAAPERRRFLKQILAGSGVLALLAAPRSSVVVEAAQRDGGKGKGDAKGKAKGNSKGKSKGPSGKGTSKGKSKGKGR